MSYQLIALFLGALLTYRLFKKPKSLKSLPSFSPLWILLRFLNSKKPYQPYFSLEDPKYQGGMVTMWFAGWIVLSYGAKLFKKIAQNPDLFIKTDLTEYFPHTILDKYMGMNLVGSNGETWRRYRKVANPVFRKSWAPQVFFTSMETMFQRWEAQGSEFSIEVGDWYQRLTLDVLGTAVLGYDLKAVTEENSPALMIYRKVMESMSEEIWVLLHWFDRPWNPLRRAAWEAFARLDELFYSMIDMRMAQLKEANWELPEKPDLITLMIQSNQTLEVGLTRKEIRDNIAIFFLAGHDTTALALGAITYNLAKYPEWQERARQEILEKLGEEEYPKVSTSLPVMEAIIRESLRLYPPVRGLPFRTLTQDQEVEDEMGNIISLPKGSTFWVDAYLLHRNPKYWKCPEEFLPDRWIKSESEVRMIDSFSYIPFGEGVRSCIGKNFSLLEQRILLTMMLRRYEWQLPVGSIHEDGLKFYDLDLLKQFPLNITFRKLSC